MIDHRQPPLDRDPDRGHSSDRDHDRGPDIDRDPDRDHDPDRDRGSLLGHAPDHARDHDRASKIIVVTLLARRPFCVKRAKLVKT